MIPLSLPAILANWRVWCLAGIVAAFAFLTWRCDHLSSALKSEQSAHQTDIATWRAGGIQATADALIAARETETRQKKVTEDAEQAVRDSGARYAELTRLYIAAQANRGSPGKADLPSAVGGPAKPASAASAPIVVEAADLAICNDAITAAEGWQRLYRDQQKP